MTRPAAFGAILACCIGGSASGCSGDSAAERPHAVADGGRSDAPTGPSPLPPIPRCSPTFDSIRADIIVPTCALPLCHVGQDSYFELVPGEPDQTLIDVPSMCRGMVLVAPGDPERSYLWHKLTRDAPECGDRMPWGYDRLPDNALECIRSWILSL